MCESPSGSAELGQAAEAGVRDRLGALPDCGGELKIIAAIMEHPVIEKILTHLGLQARAPQAAHPSGVLVEEQDQTYMADDDADSDEARVFRLLQAAERIASPSARAPARRC